MSVSSTHATAGTTLGRVMVSAQLPGPGAGSPHLTEGEGEGLAEGDGLGVGGGPGEGVGLGDGEGVGDGVGLEDGAGLGAGVALGEGEGLVPWTSTWIEAVAVEVPARATRLNVVVR
jgi:hypothetical protein